MMRTVLTGVFIAVACACPEQGKPCASNGDCRADEVCSVGQGGGRCIAASALDAGFDDDEQDDAGLDDEDADGAVDADADAGVPDPAVVDAGTLLRGTVEVAPRRLRGDAHELSGRLAPPAAPQTLLGNDHELTPAAPLQVTGEEQ